MFPQTTMLNLFSAERAEAEVSSLQFPRSTLIFSGKMPWMSDQLVVEAVDQYFADQSPTIILNQCHGMRVWQLAASESQPMRQPSWRPNWQCIQAHHSEAQQYGEVQTSEVRQMLPHQLILATNSTESRGGVFTAEGLSYLQGDGLSMALNQCPSTGMRLLIKTADCVPLVVHDVKAGRYAVLHAGWCGAAAGILPVLLQSWSKQGSAMNDIGLYLGPHIRSCCYEVGDDCLAQFPVRWLQQAVYGRNGRQYLSLAKVLTQQAQEWGIDVGRMVAAYPCTCCHSGGLQAVKAPIEVLIGGDKLLSHGAFPYASYRRRQASIWAAKGAQHTHPLAARNSVFPLASAIETEPRTQNITCLQFSPRLSQ